jgi:hypothetical protein
MNKIGLLLLFVLCSTPFFAQNKEKNRDGDASEQREVRDFTRISTELAADIYIRQADTFSFVAKASEEALERMETRVKDGKLWITKPANWRFWNELEKVRIYITVPSLDDLIFSGAGNVYLKGHWKGDKMRIKLEGAYNLTALDVEIEDLKVQLDGVGNIDIGGKAPKAQLTLNGTGSIDAYDLTIQNARCAVNGVGKLECNVVEELIADVSGMGSVRYRGEPKNVRSSVSGLGKVKAEK